MASTPIKVMSSLATKDFLAECHVRYQARQAVNAKPGSR